MEIGAQPDPMHVGECHRVLLVEDGDADVVAFHRAVHDRRLPIELQRARNRAEAMAMLQLQLDCGRTDELLILLDLELPDAAADAFLTDLRRSEKLAATPVVGFAGTLADEAEDFGRQHGLVSVLSPSLASAESTADVLIRFVESYLQLRV